MIKEKEKKRKKRIRENGIITKDMEQLKPAMASVFFLLCLTLM